MAHFAQVVDGIVTQVVVVDNKDCGDLEFPASEPVGQEFLANLGLGEGWLQCSYSNSFRRRMAGENYFYDAAADVFYPQSPGEGWVLDEETWQWVSGSGNRLPRD